MSEEVLKWIDEVVERTVDEFTPEEYAEEWDLDALVKQMATLYETEITADELREESARSRATRCRGVPGGRARTSTARRRRSSATELMRELERFVILQVVDQRWREHLEAMDYLREGVHLRAMAQKDPLVEYRHEGHIMFEELGAAIREEVVLDAVPRAARAGGGRRAAARAGGGGGQRRRSSTSTSRSPARMRSQPRAAPQRRRPRRWRCPAAARRRRRRRQRPIVKSDSENIGRNDPCWCGAARSSRSATALDAPRESFAFARI